MLTFEQQLGEGATAVVKRAIETASGRPVAVKIASKTGHWTESTAVRFRFEVKLIASLDHRYIVNCRAIHEVRHRFKIFSLAHSFRLNRLYTLSWSL